MAGKKDIQNKRSKSNKKNKEEKKDQKNTKNKKTKDELDDRNFSNYITKVMQNVDAEIKISDESMIIINNFMIDMFEKIASEASNLVKWDRQKTLTNKHIETAVRLQLSGKLLNHAMAKGSSALKHYFENEKKKN